MSVDLGIDLGSAAWRHGEEQGYWRVVERMEHVLYVETFARDDLAYLLNLQCDRYGAEPVRGRFVDSRTRACVAAAWPQGDGTFAGWFKSNPQDLFICWPADRGGVEHHADWRALQYWRKTDNQLVQYLEFIRRCLTLPARGYQPRVQRLAS